MVSSMDARGYSRFIILELMFFFYLILLVSVFRTTTRNTQEFALKILLLLTRHTTEVPPRKKIVLCRVWCPVLFYSYCLSFHVSQNRYDRSFFWKCSSLSRPLDRRSTVAAVLIVVHINVNGQNNVCSVYLLTLKTHLFIHSILKREAVNLVTEINYFLHVISTESNYPHSTRIPFVRRKLDPFFTQQPLLCGTI